MSNEHEYYQADSVPRPSADSSGAGQILSEMVVIDIGTIEKTFHLHADGDRLPLDRLGDALKIVDRSFTQGEIENAISSIGSSVGADSPGLTMAEFVDIVHALVPEQADSKEDSTGEYELNKVAGRGDGRLGFNPLKFLLKALRRCFRKGEKSEEFGGMKPTTRLILTVAVLSFIMALVVGGVAVALDWSSAIKEQQTALEEELNLVLNAADSFTVTQSRKREMENQYTTAKMLTEVIKQVGYGANLETVTKTQLAGARISGLILDHIHQISKLDEMQASAEKLAKMLELFCVFGASVPGMPTVSSIIQIMNQPGQLPEGHELIAASKQTQQVVHPLKYQSECAAKQLPCIVSTDTGSAMALAFKEDPGSFTGIDYSANDVIGGYTYLPTCRLGLIYQARSSNVRALILNQTVRAIDLTNDEYDGTTEIMVQQIENPGIPLTKRKLASDCPRTGCGVDSAGASAIVGALNNTPTAVGMDYRRTVDVIAAASPLTSMRGTLVFEIDLSEVVNNMIRPLSEASTKMNLQLDGSVELLMARQVIVNQTKTYEYLTQRRFTDGCPASGCVLEQPLIDAAVNCKSGVVDDFDYRGMPVLTAYTCVEELGVGIALEIDEADLVRKSINQLVDYANAQNTESSGSLELIVGELDQTTRRDKILSTPKSATTKTTLPSFEPLKQTLTSHTKGAMRSTDYKGDSVMSQYSYSSALNVGIVLKIDVNEVEKPLYIQMVIILFTAIGIALMGVGIVAFAAQHMLASIVATWEKSKQAVQEQKESFEALVSALYPKFASDRLLSGDSQIVLELPHATVFFSDICKFSTISNCLTAQELMGWIGYTFGVMDHIADFYKIYKIKTIGDSYFAISGLPGIIPEGSVDDHTIRMVRFASACVQVFSGRYLHPDAGSCLQMIAAHSAVMRKEKKDAMKKGARHQSRFTASTATSGTSSSSSSAGGAGTQGQCDMRYGVACGPVTAGVLPGKCPAFDVWGKTVNLASRMESSSRAGAVLCSDAVYRAVMADPTNPFTFYDQITAFAKGFGNVPAYFVRGNKEILNKTLLSTLSVEPAVGEYITELDGMTYNGGQKSRGVKGSNSNHQSMTMMPFGSNGSIPQPPQGMSTSRSNPNHMSVTGNVKRVSMDLHSETGQSDTEEVSMGTKSLSLSQNPMPQDPGMVATEVDAENGGIPVKTPSEAWH